MPKAEAPTRKINYLRLSVTDRCNLRCFYCTYWQDWQKLPAGEILRYEELLRIATVAAACGIRKIRITGGEPLRRRGVVDFLHSLHQVPGVEEVCLTTNGVGLKEAAPALFAAGLRHLNLSLDTLRRDRYQKITGRDEWPAVMAGLEAAASLGFHPLKINCVVLKGLNEDELWDIALLARDHPYQVRFIELMPTVSSREWRRHFLPLAAVRRRLAVLGPGEPLIPGPTAGPARTYRFPGFQGELGFISPMSEHHCSTCNRLRLTADGKLRPCLMATSELDLKEPLRLGLPDDFLRFLFQEAAALKTARNGFPLHSSLPCRPMVSMGG